MVSRGCRGSVIINRTLTRYLNKMLPRLDYCGLFDASPNPYLVLDRDLNIAGANQAYLRSTKRKLEDIVGRWAWDAFPTDEATLEQSVASFERVLRTGTPDTMALLRFDIPRPEADGGGFEVRYWSITHTPVFDESGNVALVLQHPIDVTELERLRDLERKPGQNGKLNLEAAHSGIFDRAQSVYRTNLALKAEVETLEAMFRQAPSFMAVLRGPQHYFEIANPAFRKLVGERPVLGKVLAEALPEASEQGYLALLDQVYATGKPYRVSGAKYVVQSISGEPSTDHFLNFVFQPIVGGDGKVSGIFVEGVDVTDQVLANRELERVNQQLAESVQQLQATEERQAFQLTLADRVRPLDTPAEVISTASQLIGEHLGVTRVVYAEADDSGESVSVRRDWSTDTLTSMAGMTLRLDDFGSLAANLVRAGRPLVIKNVTDDERCASNAQAYADIGVRAALALPLMKAGRLRAILNVHDSNAHDWTENEMILAQDMLDRTWSAAESTRSQAELRYERDQSRYIFDTMTEGFALIAPDWTILHLNAEAARITQRTASEVVGRDHWKVWPELRGTKLEEIYHEVKKTRKAEVVEIPYIFPDQRSGWVEIRAYPSLDGGLAFFFRDVSDRKAAQEKLQDADRRKDEFLAMLAHELRNPLAPIGSAAQLLQIGKLDEARVRQTSQIISRQVHHMTSLVDDLLDVSRVTRGLVELDIALIDIGHVVADAIEQVTPLIRARRHHLELQLSPETPLVMGDKKRLVQVIVNLLNNAAKYTREGGRLLLKTEVRSAHILMQISDNGIGMTPELVSRAFDLFAQAERSSDRSSGGLGLGLALVKSLVNLHHGTVSCESLGVGKGSTFTVCLPRRIEEARGSSGHAPDLPFHNRTSSLRILVVDDNIDAASMLSMLLEAGGHEVMTEHTSHAGIERAKIEAPQVCILDIGLPEMDGNELAQHLRALPQTASSVLIAVTGYGQDSDREQSFAAGFDHHLVKPVDIKMLSTILATVSDS
jgi:PAS domain S-box-containing protein